MYGALVAGASLFKQQDRSALELAVLGAASFKAARTIVHDDIGAVVRDPLRAMGEEFEGLVGCTRCAGTWAAAGLTAASSVAPRFGRLLTWALAAAAVNDWLQAGFVTLTNKANEGSKYGSVPQHDRGGHSLSPLIQQANSFELAETTLQSPRAEPDGSIWSGIQSSRRGDESDHSDA